MRGQRRCRRACAQLAMSRRSAARSRACSTRSARTGPASPALQATTIAIARTTGHRHTSRRKTSRPRAPRGGTATTRPGAIDPRGVVGEGLLAQAPVAISTTRVGLSRRSVRPRSSRSGPRRRTVAARRGPLLARHRGDGGGIEAVLSSTSRGMATRSPEDALIARPDSGGIAGRPSAADLAESDVRGTRRGRIRRARPAPLRRTGSPPRRNRIARIGDQQEGSSTRTSASSLAREYPPEGSAPRPPRRRAPRTASSGAAATARSAPRRERLGAPRPQSSCTRSSERASIVTP